MGTGFNHELTGRENIYLNGAILGMRRAEITEQLDAIVDFSGVSQCRYAGETLFERYVCALGVCGCCTRVDTLLVDEVLSVGDQEFQKNVLVKWAKLRRMAEPLFGKP